MNGVLVAFAIIGVIVLTGYLSSRFGLVPVEHGRLFNRVAFYVFSPALIFTVLTKTTVTTLLSPVLLVLILSSSVIAVLFVSLSRIFFRRTASDTTMGAAASFYLNSSNVGLPVAMFVLGDLTYFVPVLVLHLVVLTPIVLLTLELSRNRTASPTKTLLKTFLNPVVLASALGIIVALAGVPVPEIVLEPLSALGGAAVPVLLFAYGVSLRGQRPFHVDGDRPFAITAIVLKTVAMPVVAYVLSRWMFQLTPHEVFVAVVLAALPTAQNMFTYASVFDSKVVAIRDVIFATTIASLPVILVIAALLEA